MKFSIRDIMLFTVIVALAVGWWRDRSQLAAENQELRQQKPWFGEVNIESIRVISEPPRWPPEPAQGLAPRLSKVRDSPVIEEHFAVYSHSVHPS